MNDFNDQVLATRIGQLQEYRDHLRELKDFAERLPEDMRQGLNQRIAEIAELLTHEAEDLREWNFERTVKD